MNDILKSKLTILADDEAMLAAIATAFSERIEKEKPDIDKFADNNLLGERFRAYEKAKEILNLTMLDIRNYKNIINQNNGFDKAR
jgi:hypothetical protein